MTQLGEPEEDICSQAQCNDILRSHDILSNCYRSRLKISVPASTSQLLSHF